MNPLNDISSVYFKEVLEPQIGKKTAVAKASHPSSGKKVIKGETGEEASAKRVRQFVYDVRYLAKRMNIPVEKAYSQKISVTTMNGQEVKQAREKLGLTSGSGVNEAQDRTLIRYKDKSTGVVTRKYATMDQISAYRKNPNIVSVEKTAYKGDIKSQPYLRGEIGKKYDRSKDQDGDGDNDFADVMSKRMQASGISKNDANKKVANKTYNKKTHAEGFSNWREDLIEDGTIADPNADQYQSKIKEKKVNNYAGGKDSVVKINPQFAEAIQNIGGELLEMVEIEEEYLTEEIEIATEYFCEQGLNEDGIDILIEKLGLEEFVNFVYDISEEYILTEATETRLQRMAAKRGKIVVGPKGSKPQSTTKAAIKKMGGITKKIGSSQKPSSTISKERKVAVKTAVAKQPDKKPIRDAIARGIFGAVKAYKAGMERHRAATSTASKLVSQTAQTAAKAAKVGAKGASEFGKGVASGVSGTATAAKKVKKAVVGEAKDDSYLETDMKKRQANNEKAIADMKNTAAHKSMAATAAKKIGEEITSKTSKEKIIGDFVHSNDPKFSSDSKKERIKRALGAWYGMHREATAPTSQQTTQQTTQQAQKPDPASAAKQKQAISLQKQIELKKVQLLSKGVPLTQEELELDELNRYAKETGKSFRSGKPTTPGGTAKNDKAFQAVSKMISSGRFGATQRGKKKVSGQKPPAAGEYGSERRSPEQIIKNRRAARQQGRDNMSSRFD
jgi:hypothetical protein